MGVFGALSRTKPESNYSKGVYRVAVQDIGSTVWA